MYSHFNRPSREVVSLVEGMQRATLVQSVTGYVTFALSGVSNGILPDMSFQLTQATWRQTVCFWGGRAAGGMQSLSFIAFGIYSLIAF